MRLLNELADLAQLINEDVVFITVVMDEELDLSITVESA